MQNLIRMGKVAIFLSIGIACGIFGRMNAPAAKVHAQEKFAGITACTAVVPKSWGDFRGGSEYGLAFQDQNGVVRFVLHPPCAAVNSPGEPPPVAIDLEVQRR